MKVRRRHDYRQQKGDHGAIEMKSPLLPLSFAVMAVAACSDSTSPTSNLSTSDAKSTDPGFTVSGSLISHMFTFDDGVFSASDAGDFTVESTVGGFGAAAPSLAQVYNDAANKFIGRLDNHKVNLIVPNGGSRYDIS